ncbi:MAG: NAD-dependent epimerase/dehydratase family protein [Candidatus Pacebacteria bacterium]|jgi:GDP-4-dehydro-6-deoxy-D-mannose reductase|nr:NAD-dependent epimerase/dehydratase family protein [Candidatus Paceibacterota bacterium]MBT3512210.1 NAD-dependent epimerase/dehydratase family protein [Candidatus Paceibacterota bacterium]MBT4004560.1 NAD-dependent epimerase/dehydratase family protein [Candidatus Paceibacterota bacterium]MBT4359192.1 NAD-dependent epimerase/dehydratase family protein [Candidatus Paceibacterota bacterium]MBT4681078.1 NAD-dependent epimerase/dehydratase family protein [Candidatus Paceibacterota bacterium]
MDQPTILITGGTGFVGSHLVEKLAELGQKNIHVTSYSDKPGFVHQLLPSSQIHQLDLTDQEKTFALIEKIKPNQIYHLASLAAVGKSFNNTKKVLDNNTQLQLNILEAVKKFSPDSRLLVIGSAMSYDLTKSYDGHSPQSITETYPLGPASPYAVSKAMQDLLAYSYYQSFGMDIIRARPFNHIGERQTPDFAVAAFAQQISAIEKNQQQILQVGNLTASRDFTDVKDMVKAYMLLMEKGIAGQVYNIGTGHGHQIQEVLNLMLGFAEVKIEVEIDQARMRPSDVPTAIANPAKIKDLGWQPEIKIEETLKRILLYWRSQS